MKQILILSLLSLLTLAACATTSTPELTSLPEGDPVRGERLFTEEINGAPSCTSCHRLDDERATGPSLAGYARRAITRIEGQSAQDYTATSILSPSRYIVRGFSNLMYINYRSKMSNQDLADLIAYLLSL